MSLTQSRDLTTYTKGNKAVQPVRTYTHHSSIVNDVQYHPLHSSLIGTVSDDITLQILDTRVAETTRAAASAEGQHRDAINAVAFNPAAETVLATGSADKTIGLWDLRNLKTKLHTLENHADSVTSISWHPFEEAVLASASYDRKIMFWDLSRAGEEQTPEDAQDGPPELYVLLMSDIRSHFANIGFLTDCSCTVVIPIVSPTSVGILTILGFFAPLRRTTSYRCGRSRMRLSVRIWRTCRPRSWSLDSATFREFSPFFFVPAYCESSILERRIYLLTLYFSYLYIFLCTANCLCTVQTVRIGILTSITKSRP